MYIFILGGLPGIPLYLGSTSTSGRYEGRALQTGDVIEARATDLHPERTSRSELPDPPKLPQRTVTQELYATQIAHEQCINLDYNADEVDIGGKRALLRYHETDCEDGSHR